MLRLFTTIVILHLYSTSYAQSSNSNFLIGYWKVEKENISNENSVNFLLFGKDIVLFVINSDYTNGSWHYRFDSLHSTLILANLDLNGDQYSDTLTFQIEIRNEDMIILKLNKVQCQDSFSKKWILKTIGSSANNNWNRIKNKLKE